MKSLVRIAAFAQRLVVPEELDGGESDDELAGTLEDDPEADCPGKVVMRQEAPFSRAAVMMWNLWVPATVPAAIT
jgi:hypothetical protein